MDIFAKEDGKCYAKFDLINLHLEIYSHLYCPCYLSPNFPKDIEIIDITLSLDIIFNDKEGRQNSVLQHPLAAYNYR